MEHIKVALEKSGRTPADRLDPVLIHKTETEETDDTILLLDTVSETKSGPWKLSERQMRTKRIVAPLLDSTEADLFRVLRTQIRRRLERTGARVIAICGARENEGKSFIATNLACSFALEHGQKVVLVDLDLRRPSLHRQFDVRPEIGVNDYLLDAAELSDCLIDTGLGQLTLLPVSTSTKGSSELLSSPNAGALSRELREMFPDGIIIVDLPPVLVSDDFLSFSQHVDACLFVVEEGKTRKSEIHRALELIDPDLMLGTVMNKSSKANVKYYDYY